MARAPYLKRNDLAEADRAAYDRIEKSRSGVGFIWQALLNAPNICDRILALADELRHGALAEQECRTETGDGHWMIAFVVDLDREKQLVALGRDLPLQGDVPLVDACGPSSRAVH